MLKKKKRKKERKSPATAHSALHPQNAHITASEQDLRCDVVKIRVRPRVAAVMLAIIQGSLSGGENKRSKCRPDFNLVQASFLRTSLRLSAAKIPLKKRLHEFPR